MMRSKTFVYCFIGHTRRLMKIGAAPPWRWATLTALAMLACATLFRLRAEIGVAAKPIVEVADKSAAQMMSYDFGSVSPKTVANGSVSICNPTDRTWTIRNVASDCGCLVEDLLSKTVPAHGSTELRFAYRAPEAAAPISRRLLVSFAQPDVPAIFVRISGEVRGWARSTPDAIHFGPVLPGGVAHQDVQIAVDNPHCVDLRTFSSTLGYVTVDAKQAIQLPARDKHREGHVLRLTLSFSPPIDADAGIIRGDISWSSANDVRSKLIVPAIADIKSPISAAPRQLFFGFVNRGSSTVRKLCISFPAGDAAIDPTRLQVAHTLNGELELVIESTDHARRTVTLAAKLTPLPNSSSFISGSIEIVYGDWPSLVVPVSASTKETAA